MDADDLRAIVSEQAGAIIGLSRSYRELEAQVDNLKRNFDAQLGYLSRRLDALAEEIPRG